MVRICSIFRCWDLAQRSPVISFRCVHSHRARGVVGTISSPVDVYKRQQILNRYVPPYMQTGSPLANTGRIPTPIIFSKQTHLKFKFKIRLYQNKKISYLDRLILIVIITDKKKQIN